jgi:DNA-binding CsgD family transcriptional regulator
MSSHIVGRDEELHVLDSFVEHVDGPTALVLEGEPGIGKSTIWRAGVEAARARGLCVLCARPAEAEAELAHAGLGDLLEPVLEEVLSQLPQPRRRALEAALLLADAHVPVEARTLAVAVRSALGALAERGPVLIAVDDVQWLDRSTAELLAYALRRLEREPVAVLVARRVEAGTRPSTVERALAPAALSRVALGPLSLGAIQQVVRGEAGISLPRPTLLRVHETSGGNPLYAIHLAAALGPDVDPTRPLRVPETLAEVVRERLEGHGQPTGDALTLVAAFGRVSVAALRRAGVGDDVLEPALASRLLVVERDEIRFAHPLLSSVLYQSRPVAARRRAHAIAAALVDDPVARARHVAHAAERPDAGIAATLEQAAAVASRRGAPIAAAELGEHALRLTPEDDAGRRRSRALAVARWHAAAGDVARARLHARALLERPGDGPACVEALLVLAEIEDVNHDTPGWLARYRDALADAGNDLRLQARLHQRIASLAAFSEGEATAERHAAASLGLARRLADDVLTAEALCALASVRTKFGVDPEAALALVEEACRHAESSRDAEAIASADRHRARLLFEHGRFTPARAILERLEQEWSRHSDVVTADVYYLRSGLEHLAGDFRVAADYAARYGRLAAEYGPDDPVWLWHVAALAAHRGDFAEARAVAGHGRTVPLIARAMSDAVLGTVELWSGDARTAVERFAAAEDHRVQAAVRDPLRFWWRADYAEALLELGRIDEAQAVLDAWERDAVRLGRDRVLAQVTRCRGLVAAARGEVGEAIVLLEQAVAEHEAVGDGYGRARALLALGCVRRRARQKRAAREATEAALAGFEQCGSAMWAQKARAELGSIGGRRREQGLTAAEHRVADLAAAGRTNREVAAALFLGERTVETHLSHVYAKLGVRSRTELARALPIAS